MIVIKSKMLLLLLVMSHITSCKNTTEKESIEAKNNLLTISEIANQFKYTDLNKFSIDTISWEKRQDIYKKIDSSLYFKIYQDTSLHYIGNDLLGLSFNFLYSTQKNKRGLIEITILSQQEGSYCEKICYNIYNSNGKLLSTFIVASVCGDGGYYETSSGNFLNDSTYQLLSEDNYLTKDAELENIITHIKTTTTIKSNGAIIISKEKQVK
jgi:hypothetical protein